MAEALSLTIRASLQSSHALFQSQKPCIAEKRARSNRRTEDDPTLVSLTRCGGDKVPSQDKPPTVKYSVIARTVYNPLTTQACTGGTPAGSARETPHECPSLSAEYYTRDYFKSKHQRTTVNSSVGRTAPWLLASSSDAHLLCCLNRESAEVAVRLFCFMQPLSSFGCNRKA